MVASASDQPTVPIPSVPPVFPRRRREATGHQPRTWSWRIFLTVFVAFVILGTAWNLAQPLLSGADEPEHLYHAEAVWSGQWVPPIDHVRKPTTQFLSSKEVVARPVVNGCFIARSTVPASCAGRKILHGPASTGPVPVYVGREPPLPLLLNGWPVALSPTGTGLYLSRFLDTLIGAGSLAVALTLALSRRRILLSVGILLAATPAVVAGWGVLGSSVLEIGAAIVAWTCVALIISSKRVERSLVSTAAVAATLMVLSRPISFVYLALMAVALLIAVPWMRLKLFWGRRHTRVCLASVAAATVVSLGWYLLATAPPNPGYLTAHHFPHITSLWGRISVPLGRVQSSWAQAVGASGFNEYNGPWWMTLVWTGLMGFAVGLGLVVGRARQLLAVAFLFVALLVLPVVVQAVTLPKVYLYWQGRYDIPTLTGVVLIAVAGLDARLTVTGELRRAVLSVMGLVAELQILELAGTLRRYVVGVDGNPNPFEWAHGWHPPLPALLLLIGGATVIVLAYGTVLFHQSQALGPPRRWLHTVKRQQVVVEDQVAS